MMTEGQFVPRQFPPHFWPDMPAPEPTPPTPVPVPPAPGCTPRPVMFYSTPYREEPCPVCPPIWVATRSASATCPAGSSGPSVTKTMQGKSRISEEHAILEASRLAKAAAEAALVCTYTATGFAVGTCGHGEFAEGVSFVSLADAQVIAERNALAAANQWCYDHA